MVFAFTKENLSKIENILKKYPEERQASAVLPLLDLAQRQNDGWLSPDSIEAVAKFLNMPVIRVFEVASFYSMFNLKPIGKYHVQVCGTTPCMLCDAEDILNTCKSELGIKTGETTTDGMFTLSEVECLGACVNAPVMQINDDFYEDLSSDTVKSILKNLKNGKKSKTGSQTNRQCSKAVIC
jgi:NADH-quinone oxidoreductase subunit E